MDSPTRKDEPQYAVTLTVRLSTVVSFARGSGLPDDAPVLPSDAIENAIGKLPETLFDGFGGEFEVALPIDGEAIELSYGEDDPRFQHEPVVRDA